jgi:hypothetical protein
MYTNSHFDVLAPYMFVLLQLAQDRTEPAYVGMSAAEKKKAKAKVYTLISSTYSFMCVQYTFKTLYSAEHLFWMYIAAHRKHCTCNGACRVHSSVAGTVQHMHTCSTIHIVSSVVVHLSCTARCRNSITLGGSR